MQALGEAAADGLGQLIEDQEAQPVRRLVPTKLVVRESSGATERRGQTALMSREVR
jgi:DNA-binding LacI/PurR family transcriptional regulator